MNEQTIFTRIKHRIDTATNWENLIEPPLKGELIIYEAENNKAAKIKIGDGITTASDLPFVADLDVNGFSAGVRIPESDTNSIGSNIQPVYWYNGRPYATTYSLEPISTDKINEICEITITMADEVLL